MKYNNPSSFKKKRVKTIVTKNNQKKRNGTKLKPLAMLNKCPTGPLHLCHGELSTSSTRMWRQPTHSSNLAVVLTFPAKGTRKGLSFSKFSLKECLLDLKHLEYGRKPLLSTFFCTLKLVHKISTSTSSI